VIKREDFPPRLPSGLYVPEVAQKHTRVGVIVAIGDHDTDEGRPSSPIGELEYKVGDRVMYTGQWQGEDTVTPDGQVYRVLERFQLAAVIAPDAEQIHIRDFY
jgi:co-chaperonin GroES (HSP10)